MAHRRKSKEGSSYPSNWRAIARAVKDAAGWRCIRCDHPHDPKAGRTLTVHHLDMDCGNNAWWNLAALCQSCHLKVQNKVVMERPWVLTEHTNWFRPYVAGFYARKYLGIDLTREQVMARLPELLALERVHVLGVVAVDRPPCTATHPATAGEELSFAHRDIRVVGLGWYICEWCGIGWRSLPYTPELVPFATGGGV